MENNFIEKEHQILEFWEKIGLLDKLKKKNEKGQPWSFLDGPITANNSMGVHHAWGRTLKDLFQRHRAMKGFEQRFQNGFDCQGLWVEVEVEKELGFKNKKDIETYGIEEFVNKCKERVHQYAKIQTQQSIRLGMQCDWGNWQTEFDEKGEWIKQSHSYYTLSDENNYAIWHFLKRCQEKGLLYKGRDSVPWCPRCGTAISQHEILQEEYKELKHKAVYVKFAIKDEPNAYFLAWTTTPWTLPGNVALAVHSDLEYAKVKDNQGDIYVLLKEKADLIEGGEIIEVLRGEGLKGLEYFPPFYELSAVKRCLIKLFDGLPSTREREGQYTGQVILWGEVSKEEGTGIVHIAPGCGAEDFQLARDKGMSVIDLTDNESNYREGFGELSGKFVGSEQVRQWIFNDLASKGLVYKIEDYKHRYPTCWRCKSELIFRVVDEWYISMDKLRGPLMESVEKINWLPGFCKERELDWLRNMRDWLISKKRYWGLALPIFECSCGNFEVIGSREELQKRAIEGWQNFDGHSPHRPWVDGIKIKCKCGLPMARILDVGTPWLDAGIVPFSTISDNNRSDNIPYFHNNRKEWQKWFPAELVCEGFPGQFKNWFYVLLVMSQVLEGKPSFKNLLGFASVVDEKGEEMHKSKGNAIWFDEAVEKTGADVMRWMYSTSNPANNLRFGYNIAKETERKILTLTNCVKFFETYAGERRITNYELRITNFQNILDKWILSRLNNLIKGATESLEKFDSTKASLAIESFWINDLSLWYVRRSRKRLQNPETSEDKERAEQTFHYVLLTVCQLLAPFMPFLAEEIYQKLKADAMPASIHLCEWPKVKKESIDEELEKNMQTVRDIVSLVLAKRGEIGVNVRQPLSHLKIYAPTKHDLELDDIAGEVNTPGGKNRYDIGKDRRVISVDQNFIGLIMEEVNVKKIVFDDKIENEIELDTEISEELKEEGLVREIIRQIQDLRKKAGLTPNDQAGIFYQTTDPELEKVIVANAASIMETTRSVAVTANESRLGEFLAQKEVKIDGKDFWLGITIVPKT